MLEGRVGALLDDEVAEGGPGELIFKPRNQWHTFWNAGDTPAVPLRRIWVPWQRDTDSRSNRRAFPGS